MTFNCPFKKKAVQDRITILLGCAVVDADHKQTNKQINKTKQKPPQVAR